MHLVVVTPTGQKVDAQVTYVTVPGAVGELGILPGHRALITSLAIGQLSWTEGGRTFMLATNEGFGEVHDDEIVIVTETAETPDEIDAERARKSLEAAESQLKSVDPFAEPIEFKQVQNKKARALNRLTVARNATPEALRQRA